VILRKERADLREAFDLPASMPEDFFAQGRQEPFSEARETLMTTVHYLLDLQNSRRRIGHTDCIRRNPTPGMGGPPLFLP